MKRKTNEQREAEAKAALRQRVADIATGAAGCEFDTEDEFATAEFLQRFIPALKVQFQVETEGVSNKYLFEIHNLGHYDTINSTTEFLFERDVRA